MRRWLRATRMVAAVLIPIAVAHGADDSTSNLQNASSNESQCNCETVSVLSGGDLISEQQDCGGCGCCGTCGGGMLRNLLVPSDTCFTEFVSPMTNPVFFEDPRTLTEARMIYLRHKVPITALGGEIDLFAVQLRAAINDRLSIIATKDGYITSNNPLIDDGWADVSAGLKYNLFADPACQRLLSAGVMYELPVGSTRTIQGNGDGLFNVFLSGGMEFGNNNHWVTGTGFLLPGDRAEESSLWYWSNHIDHQFGCSGVYAVAEVNWYHYMGAGRSFGLAPIEGGDLFNFGTIGVAGNDIVTGAIGAKYKPASRMELGVAWEAPLTDRRDILDNRLTVDCILRY